ncbi:putative lipase [Saccharata proteae CBS 121410]|uniref:Lipase n=1 Tax=Saccharata proteae CBS 121410 TaxID=1314787 RepID=A0A9P4LV97_9PEZI|nr:putative lipase [Saccharata proteae CBS 121410]
MAEEPTPQPPYPVHPSILPRLDPTYRDYYNTHIINNQQVHYQPVAISRASGTLLPGGGPLLPVGETRDIYHKRLASEGPDLLLRVFLPEGEPPTEGWPVAIWFHGGGWVLGNVDTENNVCTEMCNRAKWAVVTADYRLAPESPFPAAAHDAWETLLFTQNPPPTLPLNPSHIVAAGSSAGANLAAHITQRAVTHNPPIAILAQFLNVPVLDNTLTPATSNTWRELENTPALPAAKMLWYRRHYLPQESDWAHPAASPALWDGDWARLPRCVVVVGELDLLRGEGEAYAERVRRAGGEAVCHVMEGMPHPFLAMSGVLEQGRRAIGVFVGELEGLGR